MNLLVPKLSKERRQTKVFVPQLSKERRWSEVFVHQLSKERRRSEVFVPQLSKEQRWSKVFVPQLSKERRRSEVFVPQLSKERRQSEVFVPQLSMICHCYPQHWCHIFFVFFTDEIPHILRTSNFKLFRQRFDNATTKSVFLMIRKATKILRYSLLHS
jgi:hypothetical protein